MQLRKIRLADYKAMSDHTVTMRESLAYAITAITSQGGHFAALAIAIAEYQACPVSHLTMKRAQVPCQDYHAKYVLRRNLKSMLSMPCYW